MTGRYKAYPEYKASGSFWFDKIPSDWQVILLKRVVSAIKDGTHGTYPRVSEGVPFLSAKNVFGNGIYISESESQISLEHHNEIVQNGFPTKGDLLITCVGTVGRAFVYDRTRPLAFQRSVAFVRFDKSAFPQYYKYYVESKPYQSQLKSLVKASAQGGVYMGDLVATESLLPPYIEQQTIANFLDHETAKIDTLITKQEKLIGLLKEKRQAVISHAVTKGLNPNAPMRDSGVKWLGEVPEHWKRKSLNYLIAHTVDNRGRTPPVIGQGIPMVEVSQVAGNGYYTSNNYTKFITKESYKQFVRSDVKENDILFVTVGATFGKTCLVPASPDFFIAQNVVGFRCASDVNAKYLMLVLSSNIFKEAIGATNKSSTIDNVKVSDLVRTRMVVPPLEEQIEISNHILKMAEQFDALVLKAEDMIELSKERKTALISAAVTGKIDVRDFVAEQGQPQGVQG